MTEDDDQIYDFDLGVARVHLDEEGNVSYRVEDVARILLGYTCCDSDDGRGSEYWRLAKIIDEVEWAFNLIKDGALPDKMNIPEPEHHKGETKCLKSI